MEDFREKLFGILGFFTNRLFLLAVAFCVVFVILVGALFDLQIVRGHIPVRHEETFERTVQINAPRGEIFDAHGRPLAVNFPVFTVMLDPSVEQFDPNYSFQFFIELMHHHGEEISVDSEFRITDGSPRQFTGSQTVQRRWMLDLDIPEEIIDAGIDAENTYVILKEIFGIYDSLNDEDAHILLRMRTAHYLQRFNLHHIPLAMNINPTTVAALEEHNLRMPGVYVAFDYLRYYPMGKYTTNIVGYITRITEADLEANPNAGYTPTDLFGIAGVERAFESQLRGQRGHTIVQVSSSFRRLGILDEVPPVSGDDIHLTIDAVLQRNIYYILEENLARILINRISAHPINFTREVLESFVQHGRIDVDVIMEADESQPASLSIGNFVRDNISHDDEASEAMFIRESIMSGRITALTMINIMAEQGMITIDDYYAGRLASGNITPAAFLITRIEAREITPQMVHIHLHPNTGSVFVTDVATGAVLAAVNYPTFDANNLLAHSFDFEYFQMINSDPTQPQNNRAFTEAQPPGSTFKMITALAALDQGVITPTTRIWDGVVFRDNGLPYLRSWSSSSFGNINVVDAIAVSSNYFFARVAFDMGNHFDGRLIEGIETFNEYMKEFGLGAPTGVEIAERAATTSGVNSVPRIASPTYKEARAEGMWTGGDTSNASIGQGFVNHTPASMAKYMGVLATGGVRLQMHLLSHSQNAAGEITRFVPVVEHVMDINPEHMDAIHRGMQEVITSHRGTGRGIFAGFPMDVAAKSGTAETNWGISHSTYGGFAPLIDPQIAIYVIIPFGDQPNYGGSMAGHVMRAVLEEYFGLNLEADHNNGQNNIMIR
ncbi:MAG: penicillin-binding transpeptidase domain-containing protein [Defluviitaleaceae bacterium]|nr:penicillin-binding transpeptidase domain-containing protein [Defluviitaleaceae bacterium]